MLDQLSQGLGPAAPLRPDEIAVTMKLPKRRLPPPKMPTPIQATILVEDHGEGKGDQSPTAKSKRLKSGASPTRVM